ncbi:hypothetical protein FJT64_026280 [Amphibalanus amphitrite]|uniref:Uncharacterized protein n=1 Tax=Amphibalanus amphitrite TaxID=1232801 RepID=A0A6A4W4N7_AMPAM|nr:hypothetical protein FJT64_003916 [Amphibalanus amphitrite]KAF0301421.1 hypothetical protein FJT64_026280 [Amphibalanus amphitrite]
MAAGTSDLGLVDGMTPSLVAATENPFFPGPQVVRREGADITEHVLLKCLCLTGARLRLTGNIHVRPEQLQDGELVAAVASGYL